MRKLVPLILLLPLPLFSAVFSSNSIGQEIEPKAGLEGIGYELVKLLGSFECAEVEFRRRAWHEI